MTRSSLFASDANLPRFGEFCQFFSQIGHFCKSPGTGEKIFKG